MVLYRSVVWPVYHIHAKGVSKKRAARQLQQQLGRKILICVGDGENDVPMLEDADYALLYLDKNQKQLSILQAELEESSTQLELIYQDEFYTLFQIQ